MRIPRYSTESPLSIPSGFCLTWLPALLTFALSSRSSQGDDNATPLDMRQ